jgi:hypothetical protein
MSGVTMDLEGGMQWGRGGGGGGGLATAVPGGETAD